MTSEQLPTRPTHVLEDPSAKAIARTYAIAYLDAADVVGQADPLEEVSSFQEDVLRPNPQFARLLTSEIIGHDEKLGIIERVVRPRASELFTNFLKVLARHDRLGILPYILDEAQQEHERRTGRRHVTVRSATVLTDEQVKHLTDRLESSLPYQPILHTEVDESLIAGIVIRVGDMVYDGSLRTRLKSLRGKLRERYLHEIQSGRDRFSSPEGN